MHIIDFHTHCFPQKIASRAVESLKHAAGGVDNHTDGTAESLQKLMAADGVEKSVVLNVATNTRQQHSVNDFAASLDGEDLIAFGSVHPDSENVLEELERIKDMGLRGVKFHPEYQNFFVDEPRMRPIYRKISQLGLITVFHAGYDIGYGLPVHASPDALARALCWFDSPVVAAHWGGWCSWESVLQHLCGLPIYFDTAFGQGSIPRPFAQQIVEKHGVERILFGSDAPWHAPHQDLNLLETLDLSDDDFEKIVWKNAVQLLGIE